MKAASRKLFVLFVFLALDLLGGLGSAPLAAQPPQGREPVNAEPEAPGKARPTSLEPTAGVSLPRLVKFSAVLKDSSGQPRTGVVGVTFALYEDQEGGAPLWLEVQNLELHEQGRYTVLLGATQSGGLPLELFAAGKARWLGIQVAGEESEQARILLVSVPYALKAGDAETLGGKPASAFVLAEEQAQSGGTGVSPVVSAATLSGTGPTKEQVTGTGTVNRIAKFLTSTSLGDSALFETAGRVGIGLGTISPVVSLQVNVSNPFPGTSIGSSALTTGNVDIVTVSPQGANVGPMLALGGNRAGTGTNLGVFGGIRGAKENATDADTAGYLGFYTLRAGIDFAERVRITSTGNVGIATTTPHPLARLTIDSVGAGGILLRGGFRDILAPDTENLQIGHINATGTVFTERMRLTPAGNVGIGTTAPAEKLTVTGNIAASGTVTGSQLVSTIASGTAPLLVTSATQVANLNVDLLDGLDSTFFATLGANTFTGLNTFSAIPIGSTVGAGSLFINPASASANFTLLGLAVAGTEKFRVDAEGDVSGAAGGFSGAVTIGAGTPITQHLSVTNAVPFDYPSIANNTCADLPITVGGAAEGDPVALSVPNSLASLLNFQFTAFVSAPNTVTVRACKGGGGAVDPAPAAAGTIRVDVWKH